MNRRKLKFILCISMLASCLQTNTKNNPNNTANPEIKKDDIEIKKDLINDTIYKDEKMLIVKSGNSIDSFLKFHSNINDSKFRVKAQNVKLTKKLDFSNYEFKKKFITVTKRGVTKEQVNFAGHFCFIYWGCGSPCKLSAVVDINTGIVYDGLTGETGYQFIKNSKVVIVNPPDSSGWYDKNISWQQPSQYIWTGSKFEKIQAN